MNNKFNQLQNQPPSFMQKDIINVSTDVIWDFYLSHNAIKKLTPPFTPMQVIKNEPLADNSITKMVLELFLVIQKFYIWMKEILKNILTKSNILPDSQ